MDRNKLQEIKGLLDRAVAEKEIAGANVLIWHKGEEVFYGESGFGDLENRRPIRRDSLFRLYSMTKPVTGAAAMLLLERGLIDLAEPVSRYIPAFKYAKVWEEGGGYREAKREVTLKDLLGMSSGLPYGDRSGGPVQKAVEEIFAGGNLSTRGFAEAVAGCGLLFDPGERFMYGTSADVMGAVIEAASGMKFSTFLEENFFRPLGMAETGFYIDEGKAERLAKVYSCRDGLCRLYEFNHLDIENRPFSPPAFESGGAGLISTADDYMKFASMLLHGGRTPEGRQILREKTIAYFTASQLPSWQRWSFRDWYGLLGHGYGNFMRVLEDPGQAVLLGTPGEYG